MKFKFLTAFSFLSVIAISVSALINIAKNRAAYQSSAVNYNNVAHLVTDGFKETSWISKSDNNEWIYVDLGASCLITKISILWGTKHASEYKVFTSEAGPKEKPEDWKEVFYQRKGKGYEENIQVKAFRTRYIKILCLKSSSSSFEISELIVSGTGAPVVKLKPQPALQADGKLYLTGGNWKLQREAFAPEKGKEISTTGYKDKDWIPATVPGTILTSYYNIGSVPDHNYADQQLMISESFFTANFWYRNTFLVPEAYKGKRVWLNFDGINWKADVYINGKLIGNIKGAFIRGKFDVTDYVKIGESNALAVLVYKNDNPGAVTEQHLGDPDENGGAIGFDGPTFLASIGWNWIPTIRGRNTGIWNDVYLEATEAVSFDNPFVKTDFELPDTSKADISIEVMVKNHLKKSVKGIIKGNIGGVTFEETLQLTANESRMVTITPSSHPQLKLKNPKLWWPNGYGAQNLYNLKLQFETNTGISDQKSITFGIREYTYSYENNNLRININGHPLIIKGGNWGMSEAMLRCDKEGYDLRVRMHKEMNMNMIRNWIGMVGDAEFYEACDKYGIMVWDDFWLANPVDGPHPKDERMFRDNVRDKILQRRNHASLALWCGRNEGYPPATLDSAMQVETFNLDGTRHYISSSADRPVTGLGPYETKDARWYFQNRGTTFHSEQGIVAVPPVESMKAMMPEGKWWPINDMWGKHDWTQPRVTIYNNDLIKSYGQAIDLEDFCLKSQMMNMEGPKAMFESWQSNRGPGVLVWMTHPAWPSLICQAYDYYFEPNAAFFAFKKGGEPVHIFWRADNEQVEVSNNLRLGLKGIGVEARIYDSNGKVVFHRDSQGDIEANSVFKAFKLVYPQGISPVHFISLKLKDSQGRVISDNFYWRGKDYLNYTALQKLPHVKLETSVGRTDEGNNIKLKVTLINNTGGIALMTRLKVVGKKSGLRILPVFYDDNYISLVPGESKTVNINVDKKHLNADVPQIAIEGWNISPGLLE